MFVCALTFYLYSKFSTVSHGLLGILLGLLISITGISGGQAAETLTQNCVATTTNSALQSQFEKLRKELETGYQKGLPAQLQKTLVDIRDRNDEIALQILDTNLETKHEIQKILKTTLDHLENFMAILPKLAEKAPLVRDQYVLPLSNLNYQSPSCGENASPSMTVSTEIERINSALYTVQNLNPQKFVHYQLSLQRLHNQSINDYSPKVAEAFKAQLPELIHSLQTEVNEVLPTFQLSAQYQGLKE